MRKSSLLPLLVLILAGVTSAAIAQDVKLDDIDAPTPQVPKEEDEAARAEADARAEETRALRLKVNRLIRRLDADQLADRDAAEKALVELGPAILDLLPATNSRTPAEVKQRLARVARELENRLAAAAGQPTRVTLQGKFSLSEVLQKIEEQTGNRFTGYENREAAQVEVDFQDITFWEAVDQVLDQAELTINPYSGTGDVLMVMARPEGETGRSESAVYSGVFRFEPTRIQGIRNLKNPTTQGLRFTLNVSWEPRITPISISQALDALDAQLDEGTALPVDGEGQKDAAVNTGTAAVDLELPFQLPPRGAEQIATLEGQLLALVPGRTERFEFSRDLAGARGIEMRKAGVTVMLEQVRKNQQLYEARVRIRFEDAANALESHRGWIYNNPAYMLDANGERINNAGLQATRQEADEVGIAYIFNLPNGLDGVTFVYETPALIVRMPIDYKLENIPLP